VTPGMSIPPAPTQVGAIASDASIRLTWLDGPAAAQVTGHIITGSDGQIRSVGPDLRTLVTGLINGQAYSFTVAAVSSVGQGPPSAPTVPVTPQPPAPQNQWLQTTPMPTTRERAASVRLGDGRVLVVAGTGPGLNPPNLSVCEVYDPTTTTWTAAQAIGAVGSDFGLTLLTDGQVLRTGGFSAPITPLATTELFAPATGLWTAAAAMASARFGHTALLLADGRVLVAGGVTAAQAGLTALASAELFDPVTGQWSTTGSLSTARGNHSATRLLDGRVLVVGGSAGQSGFTSAELYDPASGTWSATDDMSTTRQNDEVCCPGVALLSSGDVLVAGGSGPQGVLSSSEVYRVAAGSWVTTGDLVVGRDAGFSLTPLLDGRVLVAGGRDDWGPLAYAELYDEATGAWTRTNDMHFTRMSPGSALLADGRVLLVGGAVFGPPFAVSATAETFSPT
jgi:hypothetical protein